MGEQEMVTVEIDLTEREAAAIAGALRRAGWSDFKALTCSEGEAKDALTAAHVFAYEINAALCELETGRISESNKRGKR